ncbi:uncharacterized protein PV09_08821 [Verruconis gallopava]|uniref:DUF202 domain-containing protein n=1 Tax=Verruconis gallopava TaxID=253628 RepID=A0A0D1XBF3_9PEZI|nr:uncharacterized protein PV09_08821 [Verruconis gallopava]KIV99515.1 hypothetical protein PV09_08821 [Verruconis gallopava]
MAVNIPAEPTCAHTLPPGPERLRQVGKTAAELLREDDDREATELSILPPAHRTNIHQRGTNDLNWILRPQLVRSQTAEEIEEDETLRRAGFQPSRYKFVRTPRKWYHPIFSWWGNHVSVKIDIAKRRDHLALERTFLGYLRTSTALAMLGVVIAQLFQLQHSPNASPTFGYLVTGKPLAGCFIASSIVVLLVGAIRFWRQQAAMVRGKIWAGGWEIYLIMALSLALCVTVFAITVGVSIKHDADGR